MKVGLNKVLVLGQGERGGTDYVLKSLVNWLLNNGYSVCFADSWSLIKKQKYSLTILPTSRINLIPALSDGRDGCQCNKFIIWCMGSQAFHDAYYNRRKMNEYPKVIIKLFEKLINKTSETLFNERSLIFTDEVGMYSDLIYHRRSCVNLSEIIFPIPIKINALEDSRRFHGKAKSIAWVGRIDTDFKILPLIQLIEDSAKGEKKGYFDEHFTFIIVGSGNAMSTLNECISKYKEIHFELHEWLSQEELNLLLSKRIDILFAMGSSALLGASLGVPTVIVQPYSNQSEKNEKNYRWIDETIGHSLGEFPGMFCKPNQVRKTFDELFDSLRLKVKSKTSKDFSRKFDENLIFQKLLQRELPLDISLKSKNLLKILRYLQALKKIIKLSIGFVKNE